MTRTVPILCHGKPSTATWRWDTGTSAADSGHRYRHPARYGRYVCDHCGQEVKVAP